jgi:prepilin-type N-terminal cleavage/methylation domain-containing protein
MRSSGLLPFSFCLLPCPKGRGFTLVEVLVATVILATGLLGALTAFSMATRVSAVSNSDTLLVYLAEDKLAEIQLLGREGLPSTGAQGDFGPAHPEYQWQLLVGEPDERNVVPVDLVISFPEAGRTREVVFSTNAF